MKVSVIIPFYNAQDSISFCLKALSDQNNPPDEIILIDNRSSDKSSEIARNFKEEHPDLNIILVDESIPGPSAARNKGANVAMGEWLIFADSDCLASPNWISDYVTHFDDDMIGAVAGCIQPHSPTNLVQKTLSLFTLPENRNELIRDGTTITDGLYPTANLAVRKEIFRLVGGFNEALRYGEDHELCHKIYKLGYKIKAVENAIVEHMHRTGLSGLINQSLGFGTTHPYELKHFSSGRIIFISPFLRINRPNPGKYIWIDLNQADKKALILFLFGLISWPFYSLLLVYFLHLCFFIRKKAKEKKIKTNAFELPLLAFLLLLKSAAITMGRVIGSIQYKILCF